MAENQQAAQRAILKALLFFRWGPMPWYIWLLMVVVLGSLVAGLLKLLTTARRIPLTEEQKARIAQRNAAQDAAEEAERQR